MNISKRVMCRQSKIKSVLYTKQVPISRMPVMTDERWKALSQKGGAKA